VRWRLLVNVLVVKSEERYCSLTSFRAVLRVHGAWSEGCDFEAGATVLTFPAWRGRINIETATAPCWLSEYRQIFTTPKLSGPNHVKRPSSPVTILAISVRARKSLKKQTAGGSQ
jgi:hypothetical protein